MPLIWPIHPRTRKQLERFGLWESVRRQRQLFLLHPLGYHDMLKLSLETRIMLTDSGGLQGGMFGSGHALPDLAVEHGTSDHAPRQGGARSWSEIESTGSERNTSAQCNELDAGPPRTLGRPHGGTDCRRTSGRGRSVKQCNVTADPFPLQS